MLIRRFENCEEFIAGDGCRLRELLHPDKHDVEVRYSLAHAKVDPNNKTTPHKLSTSEVYYILRGSGVMHIDGEVSEVGVGCAVYIHPGSVQFIENKSDAPLEFVCIVDPAWRKEDEEIL